MTQWRSQTEVERKRLADKLRQAREAARLTQREVSRRLTIPQSTVSELENGQRRLDMAEMILLAELYGVSPVWFLDVDGNGNGNGHGNGHGNGRDNGRVQGHPDGPAVTGH